jgi:hypothetical protein
MVIVFDQESSLDGDRGGGLSDGIADDPAA